MRIRDRAAFVEIVPRARDAVEEARVACRCAVLSADHPARPGRRAPQMVRRERLQLLALVARRDDAEEIRDEPLAAIDDRRRQVLEPRIADEARDLREI